MPLFLKPLIVEAVLVVGDIHRALEGHLGRKVALATAYNLLHRREFFS